MDRNDYESGMKVGSNGSSALSSSEHIDILYSPLGKLGLDPRKIPRKFDFVADPYISGVLFDNIMTGYEKNGIMGLPKGIVKGLRKMGVKHFYIDSEIGNAIISKPGGWKALDLFYTKKAATDVDEKIQRLPAVRATNQRFKLYKDRQKKAAKESLEKYGKVNHLEVFAGPGRAPMNAYKELFDEDRSFDPKRVNLIMVDNDRDASDESRMIHKELGLPDDIVKYFVDSYKNAPDIYWSLGLGPAEIVSSHGGEDYLSDDEKVEFAREAAKLQEKGGYFFSTNMTKLSNHRDWKAIFCMKGAGGWNQINERPPGRAAELTEESGEYDAKSFIVTPYGHYLLEDSNFLQRFFSRNVHEVVEARKK